ncbi:MAG TPA: arsenite S-adenosylmethyltransferase, partial [Desulfobacteraceae bacterium]|nr:arsenite S-adenosylmethyltransferase [Desulfobacteraceae bacterium]
MKHQKNEIHDLVKAKYAAIAEEKRGIGASSCCGGPTPITDIQAIGKVLDYQDADLLLAPGEANLGLGCGNPIGIADLKPGETLLDLGSGAGFDAFLAAGQVGASGKVIGMDMTEEMVEKARANAARLNIGNVVFRLGKIEALPIDDSYVDVVISNCVINLSPEKEKVYRDAFRILKSGGRLAITDVVATIHLPEDVKKDMNLHTS